jgi:hypothetical protein
MAGGLIAFGQRYREEANAEMRASLERVRDVAAAHTPVLTGRMRSLLRGQMTGPHAYFAGWLAGDFTEVGQPFYPYTVVIKGTRFRAGRDMLTPALEGDRQQLLRGLQAGAFRAARGI